MEAVPKFLLDQIKRYYHESLQYDPVTNLRVLSCDSFFFECTCEDRGLRYQYFNHYHRSFFLSSCSLSNFLPSTPTHPFFLLFIIRELGSIIALTIKRKSVSKFNPLLLANYRDGLCEYLEILGVQLQSKMCLFLNKSESEYG